MTKQKFGLMLFSKTRLIFIETLPCDSFMFDHAVNSFLWFQLFYSFLLSFAPPGFLQGRNFHLPGKISQN